MDTLKYFGNYIEKRETNFLLNINKPKNDNDWKEYTKFRNITAEAIRKEKKRTLIIEKAVTAKNYGQDLTILI